jgi:hypothetical protein
MSSSVSKYRPTIHTRTGSALERAYAYLRVAKTTDDRSDFVGALQGAMECADKLFYSDRRLIMSQLFEIQNERGPRIVPEQLAEVYDG